MWAYLLKGYIVPTVCGLTFGFLQGRYIHKLKKSLNALKILNIRNDIPIIICTGYHEHFTREKALETGIKKYFMKPVNFTSLFETIGDLLNTDPLTSVNSRPL